MANESEKPSSTNSEKTAGCLANLKNNRKFQYFCCFLHCRNERSITKDGGSTLQDSQMRSKVSLFQTRTKTSTIEKKDSITEKSKISSTEKKKKEPNTLLQRIKRSESKCAEELDEEVTTLIRGALNRGPSRDHLTADYYTAELNRRPECKEAVVQSSQAWRQFFIEKKCGSNRAYRQLHEKIEKTVHMKLQENVLDNKSNELVERTLAGIKDYISGNNEDEENIEVNHDYLREGCDVNIHKFAQTNSQHPLMT